LRQAVHDSRGAFNWEGLLTGFPALSMLVIGLYQGDRLDWLNSPLISVMLGGGGLLFCLFLLNEWSHPLPFCKLRMLAQRNFTHSLSTLAPGVLVVLLGVAVTPATMSSRCVAIGR
jgi:DHA2 family multidrug resistance protein